MTQWHGALPRVLNRPYALKPRGADSMVNCSEDKSPNIHTRQASSPPLWHAGRALCLCSTTGTIHTMCCSACACLRIAIMPESAWCLALACFRQVVCSLCEIQCLAIAVSLRQEEGVRTSRS